MCPSFWQLLIDVWHKKQREECEYIWAEEWSKVDVWRSDWKAWDRAENPLGYNFFILSYCQSDLKVKKVLITWSVLQQFERDSTLSPIRETSRDRLKISRCQSNFQMAPSTRNAGRKHFWFEVKMSPGLVLVFTFRPSVILVCCSPSQYIS